MAFLLAAGVRASWRSTLFPCKGTADGRERQVPAALSSGGLDGSLPQISACLGNLGIPSAPSRLPLVFSSLSSAVVPRTEKVALPRSPERLHKREKNLISSTFKTSEYACKKNYNRTRGKGRHRPLSELPPKRKRKGHEKAVLRQGLPFGKVWQLHLQCFVRTADLLSGKCLTSKTCINNNFKTFEYDWIY